MDPLIQYLNTAEKLADAAIVLEKKHAAAVKAASDAKAEAASLATKVADSIPGATAYKLAQAQCLGALLGCGKLASEKDQKMLADKLAADPSYIFAVVNSLAAENAKLSSGAPSLGTVRKHAGDAGIGGVKQYSSAEELLRGSW